MEKEYFALVCLQKSYGQNGQMPPTKLKFKSQLMSGMSDSEANSMIEYLQSKEYAQSMAAGAFQFDDSRIEITANGLKHLDDKYWQMQVYEMVNAGLKKILTRNDWIETNNPRHDHKIKLEVIRILEDGLVKNISHKKFEDSVMQITPLGRSIIEKFEGIENYYKHIEIEREKYEITKVNTQAIAEERHNLEMQKLRGDNMKLVDDLIDLPKIRKQRNILFYVSISLLLIAIGTFLLKWKECK